MKLKWIEYEFYNSPDEINEVTKIDLFPSHQV